MFYSEMIKVIEAGLDRDRDKVRNYALLLSKKLAADGDEKASIRIENLLLKKNNGTALTDALVAPPVDQESRLGIVDINYKPVSPEIILADSTEKPFAFHTMQHIIRIISPALFKRYWTGTRSASGPNTSIPNGSAQDVAICMKLKILPCMPGDTFS